MKALSLLPLTGAMTLAMASIAQAEPAKIWTAWQTTRISQNSCMQKAEAAISDLGFEVEVLGSGVYGEDPESDTSVTIRCGTSQKFIFFIATHPDTNVAEEELGALMDTFNGAY
jgi:hypothetical protein